MVSHFYIQQAGRSGTAPIEAYPIEVWRRRVPAGRANTLVCLEKKEGVPSMNIALIAHDAKKELMVQFCIAYCRVLSQHNLLATGTTGKLVSEATGLPIQCFLSGVHGGDQQIAARIACNEIDLLLFFRDPISAKPHEPNEMNLLRLCDVRNIPIATNIATAEVLIHGLERGDLEWRNIVNPPQH